MEYSKIVSFTNVTKNITKKNAVTTVRELVLQHPFARLPGKLNYSSERPKVLVKT